MLSPSVDFTRKRAVMSFYIPKLVSRSLAASFWTALLAGVVCCTSKASPDADAPTSEVSSERSAASGEAPPSSGEARRLAERPVPEQVPSGPPPFGRWRLADPRELRHVVLGLSQILIRSSDVEPRAISFSLGHWTAAPPPPARSHEEARRLAEHIAYEARLRPQAFAELAAAHSEDISTREDGGSMGQLIANQLSPWSQVLDAVSELKPGEVSRVVETEYGFHIFLLRPPPAEERVSGARIVIGHVDAHWLRIQGCRDVPGRTREEASQLANDIFQRLRSEPQRFLELVDRYSEHCDAMQGGDFGSWSTREPGPIPKEVEKLAGLAVGEIAAPFDSFIGFQIVERTAERPRVRYAMDPIRLVFDPAAPAEATTSKASVLARAKALTRSLQQNPARFRELKQGLWNGGSETWLEGAGEPPMDRVLARLPIGGFTPEPILSGWTYTVARRIDPASVPVHPTAFELPAPSAPNFAYIAERMNPPFFAAQLRTVVEKERDIQRLTEPLASELLKLHAGWEALEASGADDRRKAFDHLQERVRKLIGERGYEQYRRHLDEHFAMLYLTPA
jgi:hypothetical protein